MLLVRNKAVGKSTKTQNSVHTCLSGSFLIFSPLLQALFLLVETPLEKPELTAAFFYPDGALCSPKYIACKGFRIPGDPDFLAHPRSSSKEADRKSTPHRAPTGPAKRHFGRAGVGQRQDHTGTLGSALLSSAPLPAQPCEFHSLSKSARRRHGQGSASQIPTPFPAPAPCR